MSDDQIVRGEVFEKKAEKKLNGWGVFGSKYEDAADLYEKAANCFKLSKSWDQAGAVYVKLAKCHVKLDSKHQAANAYAAAACCYKKTNTKGNLLPKRKRVRESLMYLCFAESIFRLEQAVNLFMDIGRFCMSARYCKAIAELYEQDQKLEQSIVYYDRAADLFQGEEVTTSANQCKQKIAQFAAQLEQYQKSIDIFEEIARQSLNNNLLKYGVKGHLLNAGICQLCKGDVVAVTNALERYQDLAAAIDEEDVAEFTDVVKEFDSMTKLDAWKTTLLLRAKESVKAKEMEEDDLT